MELKLELQNKLTRGAKIKPSDNGSLWCARKGSQSFLAYTGPKLLGLVALWETLGENWNQQHPDVLGELFDRMAQ